MSGHAEFITDHFTKKVFFLKILICHLIICDPSRGRGGRLHISFKIQTLNILKPMCDPPTPMYRSDCIFHSDHMLDFSPGLHIGF